MLGNEYLIGVVHMETSANKEGMFNHDRSDGLSGMLRNGCEGRRGIRGMAIRGRKRIEASAATMAMAAMIVGGCGIVRHHHHDVKLTWNASASSNVIGYEVLRADNCTGPYRILNKPHLVKGTAYEDKTGKAGRTYYYEVETVDKNGLVSLPSKRIEVTIPKN